MDIQQAQVSRNPAARLQDNDVAGNQLFRVKVLNLVVTPDPAGDLQKLLQCRGTALGFPFLESPEHRIQQNYGKDKAAIGPFTYRQRDQAGNDQDVDQRAEELMNKDEEETGRGLTGQQVRAVLTEAGSGLAAGQTLPATMCPGKNIRILQSMPGNICGGELCHVPGHGLLAANVKTRSTSFDECNPCR